VVTATARSNVTVPSSQERGGRATASVIDFPMIDEFRRIVVDLRYRSCGALSFGDDLQRLPESLERMRVAADDTTVCIAIVMANPATPDA
jgi:hypothetical protein